MLERQAHQTAAQQCWHAVYVYSNRENTAAEFLSTYLYYRKGINQPLEKADVETYVPTQKVERQWSDRKVVRDRLVVPRMVFVRCAHELHLINAIRHAQGIVDFVNYVGTNTPAIIPSEEMENFILMVGGSPDPVELVDRQHFEVGDEVVVTRGVMTGLRGRLCRTDKGKLTICISLNLLGYAATTISPDLVERVMQ